MRRRGSFSHRINSGSAGPAARPACPGGTRSAPRGLCLLPPGMGLQECPGGALLLWGMCDYPKEGISAGICSLGRLELGQVMVPGRGDRSHPLIG